MIPAFPALVSGLALLLYVAVCMMAGRMRARFDIKAPAVTGAPEFERLFRVQQNTLEQLVWFIPALWLFASYVSGPWAGGLGLVWIGGRICYGVCYYRGPGTRGPGFIIAFSAAAILLVGAIIGILVRMI